MCLVLPSRVVALLGEDVAVELTTGDRAIVSAVLYPNLSVGEYVLVDRGIVVATIDAEEAEQVMAMYAEIGALLDEGDALATEAP